MGSTFFLGFSCPNPLLVFPNLLLLGTCNIFYRKCWYFLWVLFLFIFLYLILGELVTTEIRFFTLKRKERRYWIEVRTVFNVKTTATTTITVCKLQKTNGRSVIYSTSVRKGSIPE